MLALPVIQRCPLTEDSLYYFIVTKFYLLTKNGSKLYLIYFVGIYLVRKWFVFSLHNLKLCLSIHLRVDKLLLLFKRTIAEGQLFRFHLNNTHMIKLNWRTINKVSTTIRHCSTLAISCERKIVVFNYTDLRKRLAIDANKMCTNRSSRKQMARSKRLSSI